jgi:glucose-6-phosphate isomerase
VNNFFVTFIQVLEDRDGKSPDMEAGATSGDYLLGFLMGTRKALHEKDRESVTITIQKVDARNVGILIALYERAVGFYASLVNINAYHQPGVEAGKKAATDVLALQQKILAHLDSKKAVAMTAAQIAQAIGSDDVETVYKVLEHAAANPDHGVHRIAGRTPTDAAFSRDLLA